MGFWLGLLLSGTVTEVALVVFSGFFAVPEIYLPIMDLVLMFYCLDLCHRWDLFAKEKNKCFLCGPVLH